MRKGFYLPIQQPKSYTEMLTVICKRCNTTWQEEVTHMGVLAGYARRYDCCVYCLTPEELENFGVK